MKTQLVSRVSVLLASVALALGACSSAPKTATAKPITDLKPTVLMISIDGFRPDYLNAETTPTLARLAGEGVRAEKMIPVFPSLTFPNHYTLVTGLLPDEHGIVANTFREADSPVVFAIHQNAIVEQPHWWKGEPVWLAAERQGQKAAAMFWVGSSAEGKRPSYWKTYDRAFSREARVDQVLSWMDLPAAQRPTLITLYFEEVDSAGHSFGPASPEVKQAARLVDQAIGTLMAGLAARGVQDQVNLVVTSDHGMAEVDASRVIALEKHLDPTTVEVVGGGALAGIYPKGSAKAAEIVARLNRVAHLKAYLKEKLPKKFRYGKSSRVAPVVVISDEGWTMMAPGSNYTGGAKGAHGWDPQLPSMAATFVARGPKFKAGGKVVPPFSNIHVYSLIAHLLGIQPAPNAGSLQGIRAVLK